MKIKLSKSQWENIGRKTGWIRTAQPVPVPAPAPAQGQPQQQQNPQNIANQAADLWMQGKQDQAVQLLQKANPKITKEQVQQMMQQQQPKQANRNVMIKQANMKSYLAGIFMSLLMGANVAMGGQAQPNQPLPTNNTAITQSQTLEDAKSNMKKMKEWQLGSDPRHSESAGRVLLNLEKKALKQFLVPQLQKLLSTHNGKDLEKVVTNFDYFSWLGHFDSTKDVSKKLGQLIVQNQGYEYQGEEKQGVKVPVSQHGETQNWNTVLTNIIQTINALYYSDNQRSLRTENQIKNKDLAHEERMVELFERMNRALKKQTDGLENSMIGITNEVSQIRQTPDSDAQKEVDKMLQNYKNKINNVLTQINQLKGE